MKCRTSAALLVAMCCLLQNALGFDIRTHAAITSEAIAQSNFSRNLNGSELLHNLGLVDTNDSFKGADYFDLGPSLTTRSGKRIEDRIIEEVAALATGLAIPGPYTITGWLMRGAIREDDNSFEVPPSASDEPGGQFERVFGHFYDPHNNRGLIAHPITGPRAIDWAIAPSARVQGRENHFKVSDAREAMWRALTLKAKSGDAYTDDVYPSDRTFTKSALRNAYWATTFRALGDAIHLLQDMAQPQHTRNDLHSGLGCLGQIHCAGGHASFFEHYLKARTLQSGRFSLDEGIFGPSPGQERRTNAPQLTYAGYAKPMFNTYEDYFGRADDGSKQGLAHYSNRGFYTFGTNINSFEAESFPSPPPSGGGLASLVLASPVDMTGNALTGAITFKIGNVADPVAGTSEADVKLSTHGAWDQFLKQKNSGWSSYTLNYYNYDDQARLLIPRAVAYSAGLIDYFFRGAISIELPDEGAYGLVDHADFSGDSAPATDVNGFKGFKKITAKIKNVTDPITLPGGTYAQSMGPGTLLAVMKFHRNTCYIDTLSPQVCRSEDEEIVVSEPKTISAGYIDSKIDVDFNFEKELPINATDVYLQIVFRGTLGQEQDAVAVGTKDISEPTFISYFNATDYIRINQEVYTRVAVAGSQTLLDLVRPRSCVINNNTQLSDSCLQPKSVALGLVFRRPGGPVGEVREVLNLPPQRFVRLAVLMEAEGIQKATREEGCSNTIGDLDYSPLITKKDSDGSESYATLSTVRGVYGFHTFSCILHGDGVLTGPDNRDAAMPPLENKRAYPFPRMPQN